MRPDTMHLRVCSICPGPTSLRSAQHPTSSGLVGAHQLLIRAIPRFPLQGQEGRSGCCRRGDSDGRRAPRHPRPCATVRVARPTPAPARRSVPMWSHTLGPGIRRPHRAVSQGRRATQGDPSAVAMEGLSCVLLDNLDGPLGSSALAAALTATSWRDRLLGVSRTVEAPLTTMWQSSGNNTVFRGDLGRRVVPIDLDAHVEHPEDRGGWRYPDLLRWVREHRAGLLVAALTILRGYHVAGRPAHRCGPCKGSFEGWDDLIRGAVVWAEFGDPLAGTERIRREDDGDVAALRHALEQWGEAFLDQPTTAAEAVAAAIRRPTPRAPTIPACGTRSTPWRRG